MKVWLKDTTSHGLRGYVLTDYPHVLHLKRNSKGFGATMAETQHVSVDNPQRTPGTYFSSLS